MNTYSEKLLGVRIDPNLTWQQQIDHICNVVSTRLALLRRIKLYIDVPTRILYFNGYVLPYFDYCSLIWGTCTLGNIERIEKLQKSAARIILDASYDVRTADLYRVLGWDSFTVRQKRKQAIMMYKSLNGLAPSYMKDMFTFNNEIHSHHLRSISSDNLYLQRGRTEVHKKRFSYIGAKVWNELPDYAKVASSLNKFKNILKEVF